MTIIGKKWELSVENLVLCNNTFNDLTSIDIADGDDVDKIPDEVKKYKTKYKH